LRTDYRVMWWLGNEDGLWTEVANQKYVDGSFDGIFYRLAPSVRHRNLEFLGDLPGLRYIEIVGKVEDDTSAFLFPELEELALATKSRRSIPEWFPAQKTLKRLLINHRPGIDAIREMSMLRALTIYLWVGPDLGFLGPKPSLEELVVEGTRNLASLVGVESCHNLVEVEMSDIRVNSLAPLRNLRELRRIWLLGSRRIRDQSRLDLSDLEQLANLEELRLTEGGMVRSLRPLLALPRLRDVRLRGTTVEDGDLSPLEQLRSTTRVVGPDE
jgi:hypothetical protein